MPGLLSHAQAVTKLPAQDLRRPRAFYRDKLGLEPVEERTGGRRPSSISSSRRGRPLGNPRRWHSRSRTLRRPWPTCERGV